MNTTQDHGIIIDAQDMILGRLSSHIAQLLLLGHKVTLVNCQDVVIIGNPEVIFEKYAIKRRNKVVKKGPYIHRSPAKIVQRAIRGMVPWQKARGKEAMKRLTCYASTPSFIISKEKSSESSLKINYNTTLHYVTMKEVSEKIGYYKK